MKRDEAQIKQRDLLLIDENEDMGGVAEQTFPT